VIRIQIFPTQWEFLALKSKRNPARASTPTTFPTSRTSAFALFKKKPTIDKVPSLFREAEKKLGVTFPRVAFVRTNLAGGKRAIAAWVKTL
jgi:hypothetical protein